MHKHTMQILHIFTLFVGIQILSFHAFAKEAVMSESTKQGIMVHNPKGAIGDSFEFGIPFAHEGDFFRGHPDEVDQWVDVLYEDSRQVAAIGFSKRVLCPASSQNEAFSREEPAFGIFPQV